MWSNVKAWLRLPLFAACEGLWATGFALNGFANRKRVKQVPRWSPSGDGRVLVIAPHPDDETVGCGGTIALHTRAGAGVTVLQVTDGCGSRARGLDAETMARMRQAEARRALQVLGVTCLEQMMLPEKEWSEAVLQHELCARVKRICPDVIYAPSCIDFHPEHLRVARALARTLEDSRARVRIYEIGVPLTSRLTNLVADISTVSDVQDAALSVYASQADALNPLRRLRRYHACYYGVARSAEVFWELSPRAYKILMERGDWLRDRTWSPELTPFRSLRPRPFTDPFAFWSGERTRRALRKRIEESDK